MLYTPVLQSVPEMEGIIVCHGVMRDRVGMGVGDPFLRIHSVEFMYLVFMCMPGERYHKQFSSLLCL